MRLKLFKKYFFTTSVIILICFSVTVLILSTVVNNYIIKTKTETLINSCEEVSAFIDKTVENGQKLDVTNFFYTMRTVSDVSKTDMFITDNSGKVIVCSCDDWEKHNSCMHSVTEIKGIKEKNTNIHFTTLGIYTKPHYVTFKHLYGKNTKPVATVYAASSAYAVKDMLRKMGKLFVFSAFIPIIIMFFAIYAMTYRMTKPLKQMSEASKAMARGDFSKRIPVTSDDEIGELSAAFNMMTNSLSALEGMRRSFVANVSHELKTPMTTISGFIDGILDGTIESDKQEYYLNIVSDEIKRLSRIVQSMLSMSRLESGEFTLKPELFDLREMLFTIVISQEQRINEKSLNVVGLDEIPNVSVTADKDLLYQAIYNLVDNAIKFIDDNGTLSFYLKCENRRVKLSVKNTGKGIPQKDLPYVFERFYKVDKSRSNVKNSTGLGLYIVKTILSAHGGTVSVSSKENIETVFTVVLPENKI